MTSSYCIGEGNGTPFQYSCLENPMDREAWWAAVHGVDKSRTQLISLLPFTFMRWRRKWQPTPVFLPGESQGRGEPCGLPSMGSHRVGHNWSDLAAVAAELLYWTALYTTGIIVVSTSFIYSMNTYTVSSMRIYRYCAKENILKPTTSKAIRPI